MRFWSLWFVLEVSIAQFVSGSSFDHWWFVFSAFLVAGIAAAFWTAPSHTMRFRGQSFDGWLRWDGQCPVKDFPLVVTEISKRVRQ